MWQKKIPLWFQNILATKLISEPDIFIGTNWFTLAFFGIGKIDFDTLNKSHQTISFWTEKYVLTTDQSFISNKHSISI